MSTLDFEYTENRLSELTTQFKGAHLNAVQFQRQAANVLEQATGINLLKDADQTIQTLTDQVELLADFAQRSIDTIKKGVASASCKCPAGYHTCGLEHQVREIDRMEQTLMAIAGPSTRKGNVH